MCPLTLFVTGAHRQVFRILSSPSSGSYPFHTAFIYLRPAVWDFLRAPAKFRAMDTILTFQA